MIDDIIAKLRDTTHLGRLATSEVQAALEAITAAELQKLLEWKQSQPQPEQAP